MGVSSDDRSGRLADVSSEASAFPLDLAPAEHGLILALGLLVAELITTGPEKAVDRLLPGANPARKMPRSAGQPVWR